MTKSKTTKPKLKAEANTTPAAEPAPAKRRRRRRRSRSQVVAQRVLIDIKHKQRDFLRQVSAMLSDALGFEVRVALVRAAAPALTPTMRRAQRMTRQQARRQMADSLHAPIVPGDRKAAGLDDAIPF